MRTIAITFADDRYEKTRERFRSQLEQCGVFDEIIAYSPADFDEEFRAKHQSFIENNPRGYGYWLWKPYFILKTLRDKCKDNDILVYADAGCTIVQSPQSFIDVCKESRFGIIAGPSCLIREFTKMDLFSAMGMPFEAFVDKWQVEAGRLTIQKRESTMRLIEEWWHYAQQYHLIDDSPSKIPNHPSFQDHRHDQSIFTLVGYKHGLHVVRYEGTIDATRLMF